MNSALSEYPRIVPFEPGVAGRPGGIFALPATRALLVQGAAGAMVVAAYLAWSACRFPSLPTLTWALLQGTIAAALAGRSVARWWLPIHFLFVPALLAAHRLALPPGAFLAAFALLWLVHGATYRTQVPLHLSRRRTIAAAARMLPPRAGLRVVDLGSGLGGVLRSFARIRPDAEYLGIEAALLPFVVSWLSCRLRGRIAIRRADIWDADLGQYDVVYSYLSPAAMPRLWAKATQEMRPGTLLISNSFAVPGVPSTVSIAVRGGGVLHLWRMGDAR